LLSLAWERDLAARALAAGERARGADWSARKRCALRSAPHTPRLTRRHRHSTPRDRLGGEGPTSTSRSGSPPQLAAASDRFRRPCSERERVRGRRKGALTSQCAYLCTAITTRFTLRALDPIRISCSGAGPAHLLTFLSFRKFYAYPTVSTFTNALLLSEENATAENLHLASASRQLARKPGRADRRAARQGPAASRLRCP
jgi:hypothetical protein